MADGNETTALALPETKLVGLPERFQPRNLTELMSWGKLVVASGCAPKGMNEAAVVLAVQMGAELQITPTQALQNIAVINGRPSIWGDLGLALFRRDAKYQSFEERDPSEALAKGGGWCRIVMKDGTTVERTFSKADAEKAGLWGKPGPWQQYPGRMLMYRSRWWAMRDASPEVFKGLSAREEQEYIRDAVAEGDSVRKIEKPRSEGVDPKEVEKFARESGRGTVTVIGSAGGNGGSAPPVDRSSLEKVFVKDTAEKSGNGKTFYVIKVEKSSGGLIDATTFDRNIYETGGALRGNFGLAGFKTNGKYTNITHLEADASEQAPPEENNG